MILKHKFSIIFCILVVSSLPCFAQQKVYDTTTIKLFDDLEAIQAVYAMADHLKFSATYYLEDVDSVTVRDTTVADFKVNGENFSVMIDSVLGIQNDRWFGTIYYQDYSVIVQKPVALPRQVFGVNVRDSLFQQIVMTSMTSTDSSGYRRITIHCNPNSPYVHYDILFNKETYRVNTINYSLRKEVDTTSIKRVNMVVKFSGYLANAFDDSVFSTDSFFIVKNSGEIELGSAIPEFEIINMIKQQ